MSFKILDMEDLTQRGLNLRSYYKYEFLYVPPKPEKLIENIEKLKKAYIETKGSDGRPKMFDFIEQITTIIKNSDLKKEEGILDLVNKYFGKKCEKDIQKRMEKDALKSWVILGALLFIRFKIAKEYYDVNLSNGWGLTCLLLTPNPNSSVLYRKIGEILCPKNTLSNVQKPLYDNVKKNPVNYYAMVQSLSALKELLDKIAPESKPEYLKQKVSREKEMVAYLKTFTDSEAYKSIYDHLEYLEKQEKVVASINSLFVRACVEIKKIKPSSFESLSSLAKTIEGLNCHVSVKTLLNWSLRQISNNTSKGDKLSFEQLLMAADFISCNAIIGAAFLLRANLKKLNNNKHANILETIENAMGFKVTNKFDESDPEDIELLVGALSVYKNLVEILPDLEVHQALWGDSSVELEASHTITKLEKVTNPSLVG